MKHSPWCWVWPWMKVVPRCKGFPPCPIHSWWTLWARRADSLWFCGRKSGSLGASVGCWEFVGHSLCWGVRTGQPTCLWSVREPRPKSQTQNWMSSEKNKHARSMKDQKNSFIYLDRWSYHLYCVISNWIKIFYLVVIETSFSFTIIKYFTPSTKAIIINPHLYVCNSV